MNLFFDLDGTLLDSRERLYQLFKFLVPQSTLSFDEYWALKRSKIDHKQILATYFNFDKLQINDFEKKWLVEIEDEKWLAFDKTFPSIADYLSTLKANGHTLFLVTSRQFKEKVSNQLIKFQLTEFFSEVFVTQQQVSKSQLLSSNETLKNCWMIGDTGSDIIEGKKLEFMTVAVCSGFLSREKLEEYKPDYLFERVTDFIPEQIL